MSDQPTFKPMAMLLQDPYSDDQGEYLHEDYQFPLDQDFLVGMGSSKFIVREDSDRGDYRRATTRQLPRFWKRSTLGSRPACGKGYRR
jgi:hypothetical protein